MSTRKNYGVEKWLSVKIKCTRYDREGHWCGMGEEGQGAGGGGRGGGGRGRMFP